MRRLLFLIFWVSFCCNATGQIRIDFAGENIPLHENFVRSRLMDAVKSMNSPRALARLREKAGIYLPYIAQELKANGIPEDFKYLPIVESGLGNVTSQAGAHGFWQFMPETAKDMGLKVTYSVDERNNVVKSTRAACKYLNNLYDEFGSWTLVACAYNFGIGNVRRTLRVQRNNDYYSLRLNRETAQYIYRIIAIKELLERPEMYRDNFSYDLFDMSPEELPETAGSNIHIEEMPLVTVKVVSDKTNPFLDFIERSAPKQAPVFFRLVKHNGKLFLETLNRSDMYGVIMDKGVKLPLEAEYSGDHVVASVHNIQLEDLQGNQQIDSAMFYPGLVLRIYDYQ